MSATKRVPLRERRQQKEQENLKRDAKSGVSRSELLGDRYQAMEEKNSQEDHDHLTNALRLAEQTQTVGAETIVKLKGQSEQMEKVSGDLAETNDSLARSDRVLKGMKSMGATFMNAFRSKPVETAEDVKLQRTMKQQEKDERIRGRDRDILTSSKQSKLNQATSSTEDAQLDALGAHLKNIRVMAEDINDELDYQDNLLDSIDAQVDDADSRIQTTNSRMRRLIGK